MASKIFYFTKVVAYGILCIITKLEFFQHHFAKSGHRNTSCDPHLHPSHQATNAALPHAKRPPPGGYVQTPLPEQCIFLVVAFERLRRYNPESNVTQAALLYRRLNSSSLPRTLSMQYRHNRGLYTDGGRAVVWNDHWQRQVGPDGTESR